MNGHVDPDGRALVTVSIRPTTGGQVNDVEAWVDTGFNGDLVLPRGLIERLALPASGTVKAVLADSSQVALQTYSCVVDWFDQERNLEVVSNDGEYPLLGVGLLLDHDLRVSYRTGELVID
jgi:clan AA aspartic protease